VEVNIYIYFAPGLHVQDSIAIDVMTLKCQCYVMRGTSTIIIYYIEFLMGSFFIIIISFRRRVGISPARLLHSFHERTKTSRERKK